MRCSPRAFFRFEIQARRQIASAEIGSCRKVVNLVAACAHRSHPQTRHLSTLGPSVPIQATPTPAPQDEKSSITLSLNTQSSPPQRPQASAEGSALPNDSFLHLPLSCPGCGGLTQEVDKDEAGFYSRSRKLVRNYIRNAKHVVVAEAAKVGAQPSAEGDPFENDGSRTRGDGLELQPHQEIEEDLEPPFCDRCHDIIHQSKGASIAHPTIDSIADTIAESPHRRNHVYHVLDAVDFPLSLLPQLFNQLNLARPRSQNRRSQHDFSTRTTVSFIITRSDLLAPEKEMVDSLMPYFESVLRQALGRRARNMRLGNVHLLSAKRGWWTKRVKDDIRQRGGGNWMVGKFNVGKSNLFEVLFPKGGEEQAPNHTPIQRLSSLVDQDVPHDPSPFSESSLLPPPQPQTRYPVLPLVSSLPGTTASPIRLPFGPAKRPKGELIDLPGLQRSYLGDYVIPEERRSLLMETRPTVVQHTIKAGQSLLLGGGLVRITPLLDRRDPDENELVFLVYPFTPLTPHVTSTEKAEMAQLQQTKSGIKSILAPGAGQATTSAGVFALDSDVTKERAGTLLRAGVKMEQLPFRVKATDVLIAGIGWVEITCQVRRRRRQRWRPDARHGETVMWTPEVADQPEREAQGEEDSAKILDPSTSEDPSSLNRDHNKLDQPQNSDLDPDFPSPRLEIFHPSPTTSTTLSPSSSSASSSSDATNHDPATPITNPTTNTTTPPTSTPIISQRPPMNAWTLLHGPRRPGQFKPRTAEAAARAKARTKPRPRRSMKGVKKLMKAEKRRDGGE